MRVRELEKRLNNLDQQPVLHDPSDGRHLEIEDEIEEEEPPEEARLDAWQDPDEEHDVEIPC